MSKKASDLIVEYSEKTGNKTVLPVYFALCYHANKNRTCFPGYARLKQVSGIGSSTSVSKALKILEKLGIITIKKVAGKTSFYQLNEEPACPTNGQPVVHSLNNTSPQSGEHHSNQWTSTSPTIGHKECILKNEQRRTLNNKRRGVGELKRWVETIAPIAEELKGSPIVPLERRILEQLLHRFSGEKVLALIEETFLKNPVSFRTRGLTLLEEEVA